MEDPPLPKYEIAVTWYELILSSEKFHLHLKKLSEDDIGEKMYRNPFYLVRTTRCAIS